VAEHSFSFVKIGRLVESIYLVVLPHVFGGHCSQSCGKDKLYHISKGDMYEELTSIGTSIVFWAGLYSSVGMCLV
jgi:hypothetical protein